MKKKLFIIIPIVVAILVFVGVFAYFNKEDQETSLTVTEKRWLEKNSATKVDFEVINDYPIFGMNGNGVVFQFLSDFEETTELEFNKLSYLKGEQPKTTSYRVRVLNNEDTLTAKDLLIAEDNYIAVGTSQLKLNNIKDFKDMTIGVLTSDVGELSYYLKTGSNLTYKTYEDIESLIAALKSGDVSQAIFPKLMYLNQYIADKELYINYNFTEISKKIVLTLSDEDTRLNEIITKYFENWKNKYYVTNYNKAYFNYYAEMNKINDKTKADLVSKTYVYGYVENAPYEVTMDKQVVGIAGEYVARMERLTGIEFTYKKYKNQEELKNAIANGEVDIYFDYDNTTNEKYQSTISTFIEQYVVLGKVSMNEVVNSFESLKGKRINMLKNDALYAYFKDNGRAIINEYTSLDKLTSDNNLIVVDKEVYDYYKNSKFSSYEVLYQDYMTNDYMFMLKKENAVFYDLFNHIINTNSYANYRNAGRNSLALSLIERSTFEELYLIVLGIILLPLLILVALYLYFKKKHQKKKVKREDRRKYTDMLTSLKNRNYLNLNIPSWDENDTYPQAIVVVDLNNVKYVNDNYGHEAGDDLIVKAAGILVNTQLENSEIIRTDGNEFLIYLVGYSDQQINTYTKKLTKEMKELPHGFGAAIGYSMITDDIKLIDDAINEATLDMRTHKEDYK